MLKQRLIVIGIRLLMVGDASMSRCNDFMKPTGHYAVGTVQYHLLDKEREEPRVQDVDHPHREVLVQVWYPAQAAGNLEDRVPYVSSSLADFIKRKASEKEGWFFGSGYIGVGVTTHSYTQVPVSSEQKTYPVILFSPGFGVPCHSYTSLLQELASQGFVVFAVNHSYTADPLEFPDGRIMELAVNAPPMVDEVALRYQDLCFVLDEIARINEHDTKGFLTHRLDVDHIGAFGHSIGAASVLELDQKDARCKAVVAMDGMVKTSFTDPNALMEPRAKPVMIMYNVEQGTFSKDDKAAPEFDLGQVLRKMKMAVGLLREGSRDAFYEVQWKAHHMTFSDYFMLTHLVGDHEREMQNVRDVKSMLVGFFNVYLRGYSKNDFIKQLECSTEDRFSVVIKKE